MYVLAALHTLSRFLTSGGNRLTPALSRLATARGSGTAADEDVDESDAGAGADIRPPQPPCRRDVLPQAGVDILAEVEQSVKLCLVNRWVPSPLGVVVPAMNRTAIQDARAVVALAESLPSAG